MEEPRPSVHTHTHATHAHTRKHTTIHTTTLSHTHTHTREVISADLGFTPSTSSIHPCIVHRRSGAEPHVDGEGVAERRSGIKLLPPLTELQLSRNSIADLVRPLGPQCVRVCVCARARARTHARTHAHLHAYARTARPCSRTLRCVVECRFVRLRACMRAACHPGKCPGIGALGGSVCVRR